MLQELGRRSHSDETIRQFKSDAPANKYLTLYRYTIQKD